MNERICVEFLAVWISTSTGDDFLHSNAAWRTSVGCPRLGVSLGLHGLHAADVGSGGNGVAVQQAPMHFTVIPSDFVPSSPDWLLPAIGGRLGKTGRSPHRFRKLFVFESCDVVAHTLAKTATQVTQTVLLFVGLEMESDKHTARCLEQLNLRDNELPLPCWRLCHHQGGNRKNSNESTFLRAFIYTKQTRDIRKMFFLPFFAHWILDFVLKFIRLCR